MEKDIFEQLYQLAAKTRENSYSPISKYKVGAAIRTATGNVYGGTNIEDAGFNSTIHAEQCCVAQMIAAEGWQEVTQLVIVGGNEEEVNDTVTPCGHCRQFLVEFAKDGLQITTTGPKGDVRYETTLGELFPKKFSLKNFK